MNKRTLSLSLILTLAPAVLAQDITFSKTRYSSVKEPKETEVALTITNSEMLIKGKKANGINMEIPYSSIDSMSYELSAHHRVGEGAEVMLLSPLVGGILMATKTKSHWLDIEYHQGDAKQLTILRLDKSEYEKVISTLESTNGKQIAILDSKTSQLNPTAESKDTGRPVSPPRPGNTVTKLLASTGKTLEIFTVGTDPVGLAFDGRNIWVVNVNSGTIVSKKKFRETLVGTFRFVPGSKRSA